MTLDRDDITAIAQEVAKLLAPLLSSGTPGGRDLEAEARNAVREKWAKKGRA